MLSNGMFMQAADGQFMRGKSSKGRRLLPAIIVLALMMLLSFFARGADNPELAELLKKGETAIQATNWDEAKPIFQKVVSLDPKNEEAQLSLGRCFFYLGEYEDALDSAKIAVTLAPTNSKAIHLLGGCYFELTNYTKAVELYRKCTVIDPTNITSWYWFGRALFACNLTNYTEAADAFRKCTTMEPANYHSWFWLGRSVLACNLTNYAEATNAFRKCATMEPTNYNSWYWLGRSLFECSSTNYTEATEVFRKCTSMEPTNYYSWYWLGRSLSLDRHDKEAVSAFESALKIKPDDFFGHYHLAYAFWQLDSNNNAVVEFQAAGRQHPKDFECHYYPGLILAGMQRFPEAVPELEKAHELKPHDQSAKILLASALVLTGEYHKAAALFPTAFAVMGGGLGLSYACGLLGLFAFSFRRRPATAPGFIFSFSWMVLWFEGQIAGVLLAGLFLPAYKMSVMINASLWVCALPIAFAAFAGFPRQPWGEPFVLRLPRLKTVGFCILAAIFLGLFDFAFEHTAAWLLGKPLSDQMIVPFLKEAFTDAPWTTAIAIIILAPVSEEILFRGLLYGALAKYLKPAWVIVITSAAFALVHMELVFFVPLFVVGLVLGYARHKTGSLMASILIHSLNNGLAFLALKLCSGC